MIKVYVSFTNFDDGLCIADSLIRHGYMPFVPRLHKMLEGHSAESWVKYYRLWLLSCDCIFKTCSFRSEELDFATENNIPICKDLVQVHRLKLPAYGEIGKQFGMACAKLLEQREPNEDWRVKEKNEVVKDFEDVVGRQRESGLSGAAVATGTLALRVWDVTK